MQDEVKEDAQTALQAVKLLATFKSKSVSMRRETQAALILPYFVCVCVDMYEYVRDCLLRFICVADVCVCVCERERVCCSVLQCVAIGEYVARNKSYARVLQCVL